jgi:serine/threonine protein kinase/tetratricopeptide (TPR) repeat protein
MAEPSDQLKTPPVAHDLTGMTVGRFMIRNRIGAGGMGQVYAAEDATLKRRVAIKRMAPQLHSDPRDLKRFLKEAQRASALNHPNIAAIYDVLENDGEVLLVMEYVEGITLRYRFAEAITFEQFLDIAIQCAEGLGAAHDQRILHGDIKPENIMLTPAQRVKILDFGVAKPFSSADLNGQTASLASMTTALSGTPAYMAPEVLLQKPYDGRADLFALGLVFYEMLGGKQPFATDSFAGTLARVIHVEVPSLAELSRTIPTPLVSVVAKLLMKDPEERYSTSADLIADLRAIQRGEELPAGKSGSPQGKLHRRRISLLVGTGALMAVAILASYRPLRTVFKSSGKKITSAVPVLPQNEIVAVLPFKVVEGNPALTALGQGLVEAIATKLGRLTEARSLQVIPARQMQEKGLTSLAEVRRQFGANLGLAVTLEQSSDLTTVNYSLLDAKSGRALGSDSITVPTADVFSVEDNVAEGTAKWLQLKLLPEEQSGLRVHGTTQPVAYDHYLRARGYLVDYTRPENVENAIVMVRESLKLDPNFGMARATLGEAYWRKYSITKQKQWTGLARSECNSAVKLGNAGVAGHMCLGLVNDGTGQYRESAAEYRRAAQLEPTNESAAIGLALALEHQGAVDEAQAVYQHTVDSHPQSYFAYNALGGFYYRRSEYQKAAQMFQKVTDLAPEGYVGYVNLGGTFNDMGRYAEAIEPLKKSIALRPSYGGYANLGNSYFAGHKFADAAASYEQATKLEPQQYVTWGNLGEAHYYEGKKDEAMQAYRKAAELAGERLKVNPRDTDVLSDAAEYYAMLGNRKQALLYLEKSLQYGHSEKELLFTAAEVYDELGETGLALEWLTKAVQAGYSPSKFRDFPAFQNLANNPQYQELVGKTQASR